MLVDEQQYLALFENHPQAMWIYDLETLAFLAVNNAAVASYGYSREEFLAMTIKDIRPPENIAALLKPEGRDTFFKSIVWQHKKKDGSIIDVEITSHPLAFQGRFARLVMANEIAGRMQASATEYQRDALVREVHHRIKNNLQGVIGLLQRQMAEQPQLKETIGSVVSQIYSLAAVHGMHGRNGGEVMLGELLADIGQAAAELTGAAVPPSLDTGAGKALPIAQEEAVPVALVLNELIVNALKHCAGNGREAAVRISLAGGGDSAQITIRNESAAPAQFNFDTGEGLGAGLNLVKILLPRRGAQLLIFSSRNSVTARLTLGAPVIAIAGER